MKGTKTTLLVAVLLTAALLATPALAGPRIISDAFDRDSNTGVALVQIGASVFARIVYEDTDGSHSYTEGDKELKVSELRRDDGVESDPSIGGAIGLSAG